MTSSTRRRISIWPQSRVTNPRESVWRQPSLRGQNLLHGHQRLQCPQPTGTESQVRDLHVQAQRTPHEWQTRPRRPCRSETSPHQEATRPERQPRRGRHADVLRDRRHRHILQHAGRVRSHQILSRHPETPKKKSWTISGQKLSMIFSSISLLTTFFQPPCRSPFPSHPQK